MASTYQECIRKELSGKTGLTTEQRRREFCISSKVCSGKAQDRGEAERLCDLPKEPKPAKLGDRIKARKGQGMRLVFLTTTDCPPCSEAKKEIQPHIDSGEIEVLDIQTNDYAADLAAKHGFYSVPKLLVIDKNGVPFAELPILDKEQTL